MIVFYFLIFLFFSVVLVKTTGFLIKLIKHLGATLGLKPFIVSSILLGLVTSLPEVVVGIVSAIEGKSILALGNVLGSNIADVGLALGIAAIVSGGIVVTDSVVFKDATVAFFLMLLPIFLLADKNLSSIDGLILIFVYIWYNLSIAKERKDVDIKAEIQSLVLPKAFGQFFLGIAIILFSADILVKSAVFLAEFFGLPLLLIGFFLVAIGTSLPEIVVEVQAARQKRGEVVFGDLLGSIVVNSLLALGLTAMISPIKIVHFQEFLGAVFFLVFIFITFFFLIKTKHRLERWEGLVLIIIYFLFAIIEFSGVLR